MSDTNTDSESDADISVEVDLPETEVVAVSEPDENTVVVNTEESDSVDAVLVSEVIDTHDDLAELRAENEELRNQLAAVAEAQVVTMVAAEDAQATASALAEAETERLASEHSAEHDTEPRNRTHPFWRKFGE